MTITVDAFVSHRYTPAITGFTGIFQGFKALTGDASGGTFSILMGVKAPATRLYRLDGAAVSTASNTTGAVFLLPNWIQRGGMKGWEELEIDGISRPVTLREPWWFKSQDAEDKMCEFRITTNPNGVSCTLHVYGVFWDDPRYEVIDVEESG